MYATRAKELIAEGSPADSRSMIPEADEADSSSSAR